MIFWRHSESRKMSKNVRSTYCAAMWCSNFNGCQVHKRISFFRFPKDVTRAKEWLKFSLREELIGCDADSLKNLKLCDEHFKESDFKCKYPRPLLIYDAVPSVSIDVKQREGNYGGEIIEPPPNTMIGVTPSVEIEEIQLPGTPDRVIGVPPRVEIKEIQLPRTLERVRNEDATEETGLNEPDTDDDKTFYSEPPSKLNDTSPTRIPPEKAKNLIKHSFNPHHMIEETPELYSLVTLPYLNEEQFNLQWVYNIIDRTGGRDRVVYETTCEDDKDGFVLIQDLMWDGVTLENIHLLAIPHRPGILSLRDLRVNHLPLLKNILISGKKAVTEKYGYRSSQLLVFLQYQPSFYHLHVHFKFISYLGSHSAKDHLLSSVIDNIEKYPYYYQDATLPFFLKQSDALFQKYEMHGVVRKF